MSERIRLFGAEPMPLTPEVSYALVQWLLGKTPSCPVPGFAPEWTVLQCCDTFVWGLRAGEQWVWASEAEHAIRAPGVETLLEARIFGPEVEALVCRVGNEWKGRLLRDADGGEEEAELKPLDRSAPFLPSIHHEADEVAPGRKQPNRAKKVEPLGATGFVRRTLPDGRVTVTPAGKAVLLRDYLAEADDTGIVRIAATRFVKVE
jgi:hypothetical protein